MIQEAAALPRRAGTFEPVYCTGRMWGNSSTSRMDG